MSGLPQLGQLFGMWGYELIQWIEPSVPTYEFTDQDLPDGIWMFMDKVLIFDQVKRLITAVAYGNVTDGISPEKAYETACGQINELKDLMAAPLKPIKSLKWSEKGNRSINTTRLVILTGPNMAGKSTYIRQVALITLMSQIGSFVPAESATIGIVDRIFTRVGASDDLARGQSTFMVEMNETALILNNATKNSLVILDEIGRGTATFDGLSIAWAVAEHLHDEIGCRTLFATHYHELTSLAESKKGVGNANVAVREQNDKIIFLRKIVEGSADRSYGIQVARLAGLPIEIIERSKSILAHLEEKSVQPKAKSTRKKSPKKDQNLPDAQPPQLNLFS